MENKVSSTERVLSISGSSTPYHDLSTAQDKFQNISLEDTTSLFPPQISDDSVSSSSNELSHFSSQSVHEIILQQASIGLNADEIVLLKEVTSHYFLSLAGKKPELRSAIMNKILGESKGYIFSAIYHNKSIILEITGHRFFKKYFSINATESLLGQDLNHDFFKDNDFLKKEKPCGVSVFDHIKIFLKQLDSSYQKGGEDHYQTSSNLMKLNLIEVDRVYLCDHEVSFVFADFTSLHNIDYVSKKLSNVSDLVSSNTRTMNHQLKNVAQQMHYLVSEVIGMLKKDNLTDLSDLLKKTLKSILLSIIFSRDIVNQAFTPNRLLTFSSISSPSKFNLKTLISSLAVMFQVEAESKYEKTLLVSGLDVVTENVYGQHIEIKSVIHVLLSNAMRFARQLVSLDINYKADNWHLIIQDDGPGLAQREWEVIRHLDNNQLEERARNTTDGNWGCGLHDVSSICENLGWGLHLRESGAETGTKFEFIFHVEGVKAECNVTTSPATQFNNKVIIILDDQVSSLVCFVRALLGNKISVFSELFKQHPDVLQYLPEPIASIKDAISIAKLKSYLLKHDCMHVTVNKGSVYLADPEGDQFYSGEHIYTKFFQSWEMIDNSDIYLTRSPVQYWCVVNMLITKGISPIIFLDNVLEYDNKANLKGVDLVMPTLGRFEDNGLNGIDIHMLTGDASEEFNLAAILSGVKSVLSKPLSKDQLLTLLSTAYRTQIEVMPKTTLNTEIDQLMKKFMPKEVQSNRQQIDLKSSQWKIEDLTSILFPLWLYEKEDSWVALVSKSNKTNERKIINAAGKFFCHFPKLKQPVSLPLPEDLKVKYRFLSHVLDEIIALDWSKSSHHDDWLLADFFVSLTLMPIKTNNSDLDFALLLISDQTNFHHACAALRERLTANQEFSRLTTGTLRNWTNGLWATIPDHYLTLCDEPSLLLAHFNDVSIDQEHIALQMHDTLTIIEELDIKGLSFGSHNQSSSTFFSSSFAASSDCTICEVERNDTVFTKEFLTLVTIEDSLLQRKMHARKFRDFDSHLSFASFREFNQFCDEQKEKGIPFHPDIIMIDNAGIDEKNTGYELLEVIERNHPRAALLLCSGGLEEEFPRVVDGKQKYDIFLEKNSSLYDNFDQLLSDGGKLYKILQKGQNLLTEARQELRFSAH